MNIEISHFISNNKNKTLVKVPIKYLPIYLMNFLGSELKTQTYCNLETRRYILNGHNNIDLINNLINYYIINYIECVYCKSNTYFNIILNTLNEFNSDENDFNLSRTCYTCDYKFIYKEYHPLNLFIINSISTTTTTL